MLKFVELFAGCGGLSLGLRAAGWHEEMANELSPMAASSFAYNLLDVDLEDDAAWSIPVSERRVLWISSLHDSDDRTGRLRENPYECATADRTVNDLAASGTGPLKDSTLVVGDIRRLNTWFEEHRDRLPRDVDLVSGGPPCQSFSTAGRRELENQRNQLPWEFVRFVDLVRPKVVLLENVSGILRPFRQDGHEYHAWFEVSKAFARSGYIPISILVNAKDVGVAQNRPRFILIGIRSDLAGLARVAHLTAGWRRRGMAIFDVVQTYVREGKDISGIELDPRRMGYWNLSAMVKKPASNFSDIFNPLLRRAESNLVGVAQAIDDLSSAPEFAKGSNRGYVDRINAQFSGQIAPRRVKEATLPNNERRRHGELVTARFTVYRLLSLVGGEPRRAGEALLRHGEPEEDALDWLLEFLVRSREALPRYGAMTPPRTKAAAEAYLLGLRTRKFNQRVLVAGRPAPAAMSIPDDYCHYSEPRTLSVREMARIQGFPDNFVLKGAPTTGGSRRAFTVPQYTQVGNAVPPLLGLQLGNVAKRLVIATQECDVRDGRIAQEPAVTVAAMD